MNYPTNPTKGFQIERMCINCDNLEMMPITKYKKNSINSDGSACYVVEADCPSCGYTNGKWKPMWWNFYELGAMQW